MITKQLESGTEGDINDVNQVENEINKFDEYLCDKVKYKCKIIRVLKS